MLCFRARDDVRHALEQYVKLEEYGFPHSLQVFSGFRLGDFLLLYDAAHDLEQNFGLCVFRPQVRHFVIIISFVITYQEFQGSSRVERAAVGISAAQIIGQVGTANATNRQVGGSSPPPGAK